MTDRGRQACHELLVELAGRLPDALLWRLRDWLAAPSGTDTLGLLLPRELMRHHVGLTDHERDLLDEVAGGWGPARRLLDAVLPGTQPSRPPVAFTPEPAPSDAALLAVVAVARAHPGCCGVSAVRRDGRRVLLVRGGERAWELTATLQRLLRAHGERTPCVEVLARDDAAGTPYHRSAAAAAVPLWGRDLAVAS